MTPTARFRPLLAAILILALAGAGLWIAAEWRSRHRKNLVLVVVDALRPDHLGCYGYPRPTSPHIDDFAARAVTFETAISQGPWTKPAMASLFTSLNPNRHGTIGFTDLLSSDAGKTMAETLSGQGYATFALQTNPFLGSDAGFARGFAEYIEVLEAPGNVVVDRFVAELAERRGRPFFAYVHLMDVHLPYQPPARHRALFDDPGYRGRFPRRRIKARPDEIRRMVPGLTPAERAHVIALYDGGIRFADEQFQRIEAALRTAGLWENTVVVLTADHGEELFDHGSFEHGHSLYNELLRVPLIIRDPSAPPRRVRDLVRLLDGSPTVLGLLGVEPPRPAEGRDLSPLIRGRQRAVRLSAFSTGIIYAPRADAQSAVQAAGFKLIRTAGSEPRFDFYDLRADPGERSPRRGLPAEAEYRRLLERYLAARPIGRTTSAPLDPETMRRLKNLGYLN